MAGSRTPFISFISACALGAFASAWALASVAQPIRIPLPSKTVLLDPTGVQDSHSLWVSRQLNCQLVRVKGRDFELDAAKEIRRLGAKSIEISVSSDARFHDGSPVRAEDVISTFQFLKSRHATTYNWLKDVHAKDQKDPQTVVIETTQPMTGIAEYLSGVNNSIFPEGFLKKAEKDPSLWKNPPGCGPYQVESWSESTPPVLRLKPTQMQAAGVRPVEFVMKGSKELSLDEARTFDLIDLPFSEKLGVPSEFRDASVFDPKQIFLGFNTQKKEWQNRANRCAAFTKIDRQPILNVYGGIAEKATNFFPRGVLGYRSGEIHHWENNGAVPSQKEPFCLAFLDISVPQEQRQAYVSALEPVFGKIRTEVIDHSSEFGKKFLKTGCDAIVFGLKSNNLDGYSFLATFLEPTTNFSGHKDPALNAEIVSSQAISDPGQRALVYQSIESKVDSDCLAYPVITIPRRKLLVKHDLSTPGLGEGPANQYSLEVVR